MTQQILSKRWRVRATLIGSALLIAGVGIAIVIQGSRPDGSVPSPGASEDPAALDLANLEYSCGIGQAFKASLFHEPRLDPETLPKPLRAAFLKHVARPWRLAGLDEEQATFVAPMAGAPHFAWFTLTHSDGSWRNGGGGGCQPRVALDDAHGATWVADEHWDVGPDTTSFLAWVTETECVGGRSSEGRVRQPLIAYEAEQVAILFYVDPPGTSGPTFCIGNPPTPIRVHLAEPLGDRRLVDAATLPWSDLTNASTRSSPGPSQPISPGLAGEFVGVLGHWSVCLLLFTGDEVYELILPAGYRWNLRRGRAVVSDKQGVVVSREGDDIGLDGAITHGGSYCMVAPRLEVCEILEVAGETPP
jgi:hypothetical protein